MGVLNEAKVVRSCHPGRHIGRQTLLTLSGINAFRPAEERAAESDKVLPQRAGPAPLPRCSPARRSAPLSSPTRMHGRAPGNPLSGSVDRPPARPSEARASPRPPRCRIFAALASAFAATSVADLLGSQPPHWRRQALSRHGQRPSPLL